MGVLSPEGNLALKLFCRDRPMGLYTLVPVWASIPHEERMRYYAKARTLLREHRRVSDEHTYQVESDFVQCSGYSAPVYTYLKGK